MSLKWIAQLLLVAAMAFQQKTSRLDGIPKVVAKGQTVELVKEGFAFTEGPVGTADGGLYFSDSSSTANRTHRLAPNGDITVYREQTNAANGLAVNKAGELFAVEGDGKRVSKFANGKVSVVTEGSPDKPLLAPNDIFLDSKGGVYFTDPGPRPAVVGRTVYIYYLPPGAQKPVVLDDTFLRPNGIILSTNGKTLFVDDAVNDSVLAWDVQSDGTVKNKHTFAHLHDIPPGQNSGGDGLAIDRDDRLYVAALTGIQVFDNSGKYLGNIPVPRQPSNLAFSGPDRRTLYITAREGLYRLKMLAQGPNRPGK
jgi:gluconolactonase